MAETEMGDEAFERLWRRAERTVWRVARGCGSCREDKEDLMLQVRLSAWRAYARFDPGIASFESWVAKIAARQCLDSLRAAQRGRRSLVEALAEEVEAVASGDPTPLDEILAEEAMAELRRSLWAMPPLLRRTLDLVIEGLSPPEIAQRMGARVGTIHARLTRARDWLRRLAT